jgi:hypothetical protein
MKKGKVNFNKFSYKGIDITNNLLNLKIVVTLALKLANYIEASNIDPLIASTFINIQIKALAVKGAKRATFKCNIYSNFSSNNKK